MKHVTVAGATGAGTAGAATKAVCSAALMAVMAIAGCNSQPQHSDAKEAVTGAMKRANLSDVSVSQDRDKGVMTLTGTVASDDQKAMAASLAKQAAPDYTIADEVGVRPPGMEGQAKSVASNLDDAIEDNFKAAIKAHKNLDEQSISAKAKNGTLVLTGSVKTAEQKRQTFELAKAVPNVQQVVNELEVKPNKHSSAN